MANTFSVEIGVLRLFVAVHVVPSVEAIRVIPTCVDQDDITSPQPIKRRPANSIPPSHLRDPTSCAQNFRGDSTRRDLTQFVLLLLYGVRYWAVGSPWCANFCLDSSAWVAVTWSVCSRCT